MPSPRATPARVLSPIDRVSEVLFGLIMVLTFTGSITGWVFGRLTSRRPWPMGIAMVAIGAVLSGLTMALGG